MRFYGNIRVEFEAINRVHADSLLEDAAEALLDELDDPHDRGPAARAESSYLLLSEDEYARVRALLAEFTREAGEVGHG